jgi:hypothetical protein
VLQELKVIRPQHVALSQLTPRREKPAFPGIARRHAAAVLLVRKEIGDRSIERLGDLE